jgi:bifunctional UDP-N-acetylglucosamine pyrophosphorylase/glucosamine-1-phosphate N-acetyltransferase
LTAIILAAGKGKRMGSNLPKVLQPLLGKPMILYIARAVHHFSPEETVVVASPEGVDFLKEILGNETTKYVIQPQAAGTADAVKRCAKEVVTRRVMILCGDVPLIRPQTLSEMIALHQSRAAVATLLSTELPDPSGYGRVIRNGDGTVKRIVEHKDDSSLEKDVREINSGTYIFETSLLFDSLEKVKPSPVTGEYYLTDVVSMMVDEGHRVEALKIDDRTEVMGINDPAALRQVENIFRERLINEWLRSGVRIENPQMVEIEGDVTLFAGSQITGRVNLKGSTSVGAASSIGPYVQLEDTVVEGGNYIKGVRSKKSSS